MKDPAPLLPELAPLLTPAQVSATAATALALTGGPRAPRLAGSARSPGPTRRPASASLTRAIANGERADQARMQREIVAALE